jgi:hypothetical protein
MNVITTKQLRKLKSLGNLAANAQEKEHNSPNAPDSTPAINNFENYAKKLGYKTIWAGLYPHLVRDGFETHIY